MTLNKISYRSPKPQEAYFLRRSRTCSEDIKVTSLDPLIACDTDKDVILKMLAYYESAGVSVYVENLQGERLS